MPHAQDHDPRPSAHVRPDANQRSDGQVLLHDVPQHDGCEAIGSVLNGSYKTRWHTKRAGAMWVLGSLTGFSASMAIGAASPLAAVVSLSFAVAVVIVYRAEMRNRRLREPSRR